MLRLHHTAGRGFRVTAGRFVLEETPKGDPLGRFVYGRSYLQNPAAVDIDPIELKLSEATYETMQLNGVFGALRDAGPDSWGRRIIEKHAGKAKLGELDYLLHIPRYVPAPWRGVSVVTHCNHAPEVP